MASSPAIVLNGVTRVFPRFTLGPISTRLHAGMVYGLLGPNGSGKSTLLNLLTCQLRATAGTIETGAAAIGWGDVGWKQRVAYVHETPSFFDEWTAAQVLAFGSRIYSRWNARFAGELTERFTLPLDVRVCHLSKGTRVKLGIVLGLAHGADVLVLDEPTAGVDPTARREFQRIVRELAAASPALTVILSSHIFEDIDAVADHVLFLRVGRVVFESALPDLRAMSIYRAAEGQAAALPGARLAWRGSGSRFALLDSEAAAVAGAGSPDTWERQAVPDILAAVYHGTETLCALDISAC